MLVDAAHIGLGENATFVRRRREMQLCCVLYCLTVLSVHVTNMVGFWAY